MKLYAVIWKSRSNYRICGRIFENYDDAIKYYRNAELDSEKKPVLVDIPLKGLVL